MQDTTGPLVDELRVAMTRKRMSQEALAELLGWDRGKLQRRLSGEVDPTVSELKAIAGHLDLSLAALAALEERAS